MLRRTLTILVAAAGLSLAPAAGAVADGGVGVVVSCQGNTPTPGCAVTAQTPGTSGGSATDVQAASPATPGTQVCSSAGQTMPCSLDGYGWLGKGGCYYQLDPTWRPPAWDTADQPPPGQPGAFYDVSCFGTAGTGSAIFWLPAGAAPGPPPPAPAVLAQQATNRLSLQVGTIEASPPAGAEQLVNLPTWVWLGGWAPVSASAAVPGESVTATARPVSATWTFGDGSRVVCAGPGTPYRPGDDPQAPSPTCGHTYSAPSTGQPAGVYLVTVAVSWAVNWAGAGQSGTQPPLTVTATTSMRVAESQAVNTVPNSGP